MAMAVFALTSVAANYQLSGVKLIPGAKEQLQKDFANFEAKVMADDESVMTRSYTDNSGNVWQGKFLNYGADWHTMFTYSDGSNPPFEEMPWFRVAAIVAQYGADGYAVNLYYGYLLYPPHWIFEDAAMPKEETTALPIEDLEISGLNKFMVLDEGQVGMVDNYTWGIINGEWMGIQCMFKGTIGYMEPGSALTITNYNETASSIGMKWQGSWYEEGAASTSGSFAVNYDGTAFITGFKPMTFTGDFTEIHMYDFGQVDWDTYPGDLYEVDFEPVRLFKTLAHNDKLAVSYGEGNMPASFNYVGDGTTNQDISYFIASAYAELDATTPVGTTFTVQDLLLDDKGYVDNTPLAGTIPPGGYTFDFSQYDGMELYYHGNSYIPASGSVLSIQENGFTYNGTDIYNNNWTLDIPKLFIHGDASNFQTVTEELTSGVNRLFGDKTANLVTKSGNYVNVTAAEDGVIAIYSTTGALVKTVKAVAGEKVSVELGNGLYIVKVGKTAAKVIL